MAESRRKTKYRRSGRAPVRTPDDRSAAYSDYAEMIAQDVAEQAQYVETRERMTGAQRRAKHKAQRQAENEAKKRARLAAKQRKQARAAQRAAQAQPEAEGGEDAEARRRAEARRAKDERDAQDKKERAQRRRGRRKAREIKPFRFQDVKHKPILYRATDSRRADRLYKFAMVFAILAIAVFVSCAFFEVRTVRCEGSERYSGEEIIHYSGIKSGEKILFLQVGKAANQILDELPYVRSVNIRRRFPSTVVIEIEEREPTAKIVYGNFSYIIDDEGYLLEYTVAGSRFDLPVIVCAPPNKLETGKQLEFSDPLMLETLQNVLSHIVKSDWIRSIDSINIERIYSISFLYQNRFDVKLGDTSNLDMKLLLLREVIARNSEDAYGVIDVSSTERVSFQPSR